jgi:Uma2 family endonuclease
MQTTYPRIRRWTRIEYDRLIDQGVFQPGERLELLAGLLVVREPQGDPHSLAVELAHEAFRAAFGSEWRVRIQLPVALDDESEPEPDVSVAAGRVHRGVEAKPSHLALVVEVAASSLTFDREHKGSLYARAHVPDYWIVNLVERVLEVYRDPTPDPSASHGWSYQLVQTFTAGEHVTPLAVPASSIAVVDLLP